MRERSALCLPLLVAALALAAPGRAQTPPVPPAVPAPAPDARLAEDIDRLAAQFRGSARIDAVYAPAFLADVPEAKLRLLQRDVAAAIGPFARFELVERRGQRGAVLTAVHRDGRAQVEVAFDAATGLVNGLYITDVRRDADTVAGIVAELEALPGTVALIVARQERGGGLVPVAALTPDRPMAVASIYKLAIVAALADDVALGRRRWSDVVPLGPPSPPASALARWPEGAPMSLYSLAALAISASDNRAADTLMDLVGRQAVAARLAKTGLADADRTLPLLTTREAFALKSPANADLRARFLAAAEADQAALLDAEAARLGADDVDLAALGSGPVAIDRIEWHMSMGDAARLMGALAASEDPAVRAILALNSGTGGPAAARWDWIGYKGGSEPGVYATAYVAEKAGARFVAVMAWNDPDRLLDELRVAALMRRLMDALSR